MCPAAKDTERSRRMPAVRRLLFIPLFAGLIGALGLLPGLTLPLGGVPITLQSLGIMLAGVILGPLLGAGAALFFIALVALGMPLLPGGRGGADLFFGPSGGFLVGFPVAACACGMIMRAMKRASVFSASLAAAIGGGIVVLYAFGIPGLALLADLPVQKAAIISLVYLPGDLIKAFAVAVIAEALARARPGALLSRQ